VRHSFTDDQRKELLNLGLHPEQLRRLETHALQSISWRQTRAPRMWDVRDKLTDLAKSLERVEKIYIRMSTSKLAASKEASARLQSAADDVFGDADKLGDSLEAASEIANRALGLLSRTRRSTRRNTVYFLRLILNALAFGHSEHFACSGYGDTPFKEPMPPFLIRIARKKRPFPHIARIVSEATGGWSVDDAIKVYLEQSGGKIGRKKCNVSPTTGLSHS
jgi:hypothetical protein